MAEGMTERMNTRELALDMLIEIMENGAYSHLVLRGVLDKYRYLPKQERAFLTRLTEGTIERTIELDDIINRFSSVKVGKMKPLIRNLLRLGVYQLRYMDAVPDPAVCNEAVKLARKRGFGNLSGFVNGVLRSIARAGAEISWPDADKEPCRYLMIRYSMPEWIVKQWTERFGFDRTEAILKGFYRKRGLTVRTNLLKTTPERLIERLKAEGAAAVPAGKLPYALEIEDFDSLEALEAFRDGDFYVQDPASMMVAETAKPKDGSYILDVCAAPGGKSTHLAEMMHGTGMVEARDLTPGKIALIEENIARHGLANCRAVLWDAAVYDPSAEEKADIVICDLPCSGLGVIGKKTDIRYKMTPQKQKELAELQRTILETVYRYVKPGGKLVYSTCTISEEENEKNVGWFTDRHPEFAAAFMEQMLPDESGQDGFFIAELIRREHDG